MMLKDRDKTANFALLVATLAFAANFSVWTLYSVTGIDLRDKLNLTATEYGFLLAAPMLTGAILRVPIGLLAELVSCRKLYFWQMIFIIPPLFYLPYIETYSGFIILGLIIGSCGVSFTIGIRYVVDWFPTNKQGFAMGVFGAGNAGAAITLVLVPLVTKHFGAHMVGPFYGIGMIAMAVLFIILAPKGGNYKKPRQKDFFKAHLAPLKESQVWRFGLYYYFVFGSFLALLLWLPQYYMDAYELPFNTAMALTLLFVTVSSMVRALGGWLADVYGGSAVNWSVFWVCMVCLFFLSYPPTTMTIHGVEKDVNLSIEVNVWIFTILMVIIGVAQGFGRASVFKTIYKYYPDNMGSVGGMIAAIGALGGCTLPVLFGLAVDLVGVHSACFMLLYGVLALCMISMYVANSRAKHKQLLREAIANNFLEKD